MMPIRSGNTMSDAIALSSPNGRMSKRARAAAEERLRVALFGADGLQLNPPEQPDKAAVLRRSANTLRELAGHGMSTRKFLKEAAKLEEQAAALEKAGEP